MPLEAEWCRAPGVIWRSRSLLSTSREFVVYHQGDGQAMVVQPEEEAALSSLLESMISIHLSMGIVLCDNCFSCWDEKNVLSSKMNLHLWRNEDSSFIPLSVAFKDLPHSLDDQRMEIAFINDDM